MSKEFSRAATDVLAERQRQIDTEGWSVESDDRYTSGELALAAGNYIGATTFRLHGLDPLTQRDNGGVFTGWHKWPWSPEWWKPTNHRSDLVKAAALLLAEIERIDRVQPKPPPVPRGYDSDEAFSYPPAGNSRKIN